MVFFLFFPPDFCFGFCEASLSTSSSAFLVRDAQICQFVLGLDVESSIFPLFAIHLSSLFVLKFRIEEP